MKKNLGLIAYTNRGNFGSYFPIGAQRRARLITIREYGYAQRDLCTLHFVPMYLTPYMFNIEGDGRAPYLY